MSLAREAEDAKASPRVRDRAVRLDPATRSFAPQAWNRSGRIETQSWSRDTGSRASSSRAGSVASST